MRDLIRGQVGTVVESLPPDAFEVEFSDDKGSTYVTLPPRGEQMMILHHRPIKAA